MPQVPPPVNVENVTLAQYVTILAQIAADHAQIADFGYGSVAELSARENPKYPLLWVESQPSTFDQKVITFKVRLYIIDQVNKEQTGTNSNNLYVKSDTSTVLWDLVTILRDFYDVEPGNSAGSNKFTTQAIPFDNKFSAGTSGWYLDMALVTPYTYGACDAPSNGNLPPGPRPVHPGFIGPVIYVGCTDSICLSGNGGPNDPILANLRISSQFGNTATVLGDGLFTAGGGGSATILPVTYAQLIVHATGDTLVPGQLYRITDYATIYVQPESNAILTGSNPFELIVLALTNSKLNLNAWAVPNATFPLANQWQVEYDLFSINATWAKDPNTGLNIAKGSITRLIDENLNDVAYDFKNILFRRYLTSGFTGVSSWVNGKHLTIINNSGSTQDYYTFNLLSNDTVDVSSIAQRNTIKRSSKLALTEFSNQVLSNNVFFVNDACYDNTLEEDSYGNTFGYYFLSNTLGRTAQYNIIADNTGASNSNNTIGDIFQNNIIDSGFTANTIASNVGDNVIGLNFTFNTIGAEFALNSIGNECSQNNIATQFSTNVIGANFQANTIADTFNSNTIGATCQTNTIAPGFINNNIGNLFQSNRIAIEFQNNIIADSFNANDVGAFFKGNTTLGQFVENVIASQASGNSLADGFINNSIGAEFQNNQVTSTFTLNTITSNCHSNILHGSFESNFVQDGFASNTISGSATQNRFDDNFNGNTIGSCFNNSFGSGCNNNTIGTDFGSNEVGINFESNTIGNLVGQNIFGVGFNSNVITSTSGLVQFNVFGPGVTFMNIVDNCDFENNVIYGFIEINTSGTTSCVGNSINASGSIFIGDGSTFNLNDINTSFFHYGNDQDETFVFNTDFENNQVKSVRSILLSSGCTFVTNCEFKNGGNIIDLMVNVDATTFNTVSGLINSPVFNSFMFSPYKQVMTDSDGVNQLVYLGDNGTFQVTPAFVP